MISEALLSCLNQHETNRVLVNNKKTLHFLYRPAGQSSDSE